MRPSVLFGLAIMAGCSAEDRLTVSEVQYVLRTKLPLRQELYKAAHGAYATDWRDLGLIGGGFAAGPSGFVRVLIHSGTRTGWSASTSDSRGLGPVCVMYHGEPATFPMGPHHVIPPQPDAAVCAVQAGKAWRGAA